MDCCQRLWKNNFQMCPVSYGDSDEYSIEEMSDVPICWDFGCIFSFPRFKFAHVYKGFTSPNRSFSAMITSWSVTIASSPPRVYFVVRTWLMINWIVVTRSASHPHVFLGVQLHHTTQNCLFTQAPVPEWQLCLLQGWFLVPLLSDVFWHLQRRFPSSVDLWWSQSLCMGFCDMLPLLCY